MKLGLLAGILYSMKKTAQLYLARFWLMITLALIMSTGVSAADTHHLELNEVTCQQTASSDQSAGFEHDKNNKPISHDHHTHQCGSCHLHLTGMLGVSILHLGAVDLVSQHVETDQLLVSSDPKELYRPPRD